MHIYYIYKMEELYTHTYTPIYIYINIPSVNLNGRLNCRGLVLSKVAWMDCETASSGNWHQSYRALEKLYAEGKVGCCEATFDRLKYEWEGLIKRGASACGGLGEHDTFFRETHVHRPISSPSLCVS